MNPGRDDPVVLALATAFTAAAVAAYLLRDVVIDSVQVAEQRHLVRLGWTPAAVLAVISALLFLTGGC